MEHRGRAKERKIYREREREAKRDNTFVLVVANDSVAVNILAIRPLDMQIYS